MSSSRNLLRSVSLWGKRSRDLIGPALLMTVNTAVGSAIGFVFWLIAARWFPLADVGTAAAAISAMTLAAIVGRVGADVTILTSGGAANARRVVRPLAAAAVTSLILGLAAAAVLGKTGMSVSPALRLAIVMGAPLLAILPSADGAFLALDRLPLMLMQALLWAIGRLLFLVVLVMAGVSGPDALIWAWVLGSAVAVVFSLGAIAKLVLQHPVLAPSERASFVGIWQRGALLHVGTIGLVLPALAYPLTVRAWLGAEAAGRFYVAFTLAIVTTSLPNALGLTALRSQRDAPDWRGAFRRTVGQVVVLEFLAFLGYVTLGSWALGLFGSPYREEFFTLLILVAAAIPASIGQIALATQRRRGKIFTSSTVALACGGLAILLSFSLATEGSRGVALGYLLGQSLFAAFITLMAVRSTDVLPSEAIG